MCLIDQRDKERIKETADKISQVHKEEILFPDSFCERQPDSYYERRTDFSNETGSLLQEYDFHTPVELQRQLETMWSKLKKQEMLDFAVISAVNAFKYRAQKDVKKEVSAFIYEF